MSNSEIWAKALDLNPAGEDLIANLLCHIRNAILEAGYLSRSRITRGILEAYRPLCFEDELLRSSEDKAIGLLMSTGDIDELATGAGRGYAATPPRRIVWGGSHDAVLGAVETSSLQTVRRVSSGSADLVSIPLHIELGRPAWRNALVELGGGDRVAGDAMVLSEYTRSLATSGDRYSLEEPNALSVLSQSGDYFGAPDVPSGRWARVDRNGIFPAVIEQGYTKRRVLLAVSDDGATVWEPPNRDIWNWIVVGETLAAGQSVWRYNKSNETLDFLTPPPRQALRAALLTGEQLGAWTWRVAPQAHAVIAEILGSPRP